MVIVKAPKKRVTIRIDYVPTVTGNATDPK